MKTVDIAKIRQKLELALTCYEDECYNAAAGAVSEALALLPCETCGGIGKVPASIPHTCMGQTWPCEICKLSDPCPECHLKLCICCEEITKENAHLHRNCGK